MATTLGSATNFFAFVAAWAGSYWPAVDVPLSSTVTPKFVTAGAAPFPFASWMAIIAPFLMRVAGSASAPVSGSSIPIVTSFSSARTGVKPAEADNAEGERAHRGQHDLSAMHLDHLYLPVRVVFEGLSSAPGGAAYPLSLWSYARDRPPPQLPPMPAGMPDHPYLKFSLLRLSDGFDDSLHSTRYANLEPVPLRPQHVLFESLGEQSRRPRILIKSPSTPRSASRPAMPNFRQRAGTSFGARIRRGVVVLERHLQRHRETAEGLGDVVAAHREVRLAGRVVGITMLGLEVRAGARQLLRIGPPQRCLLGRE